MKNYIAYYRVSTSKQSLGLDAQRTAVSNYLKAIEDSYIVSEYSEKESGKMIPAMNLQRQSIMQSVSARL